MDLETSNLKPFQVRFPLIDFINVYPSYAESFGFYRVKFNFRTVDVLKIITAVERMRRRQNP